MIGDAATSVEMAIARQLLADARSVVVLSGAGMSTASGIPDFRGPQGVWTKNPEAEKLATISNYLADPDVRARSWQSRLHHPAWSSEPNAGHRGLVALERQGRLSVLVTQNVDGLHQLAGSSADLVVEIHGTMRDTECLSCGRREPMLDTLVRVRAGEVDPPCLVCGGILKSATISFGQSLVEADLERSFAAADACDLLLALGTTLAVFPIAQMVPIAKRRGAAVIIMNAEPTQMDDLADATIGGDLSETVPALLDGLA